MDHRSKWKVEITKKEIEHKRKFLQPWGKQRYFRCDFTKSTNHKRKILILDFIKLSYSNTYIWNLEKWYWRIYLQGNNGETDIENRLMDMGKGKGRGKCMERVT